MKYFWVTLKHKWFVFLASFKVGLPLWRALVHDLSKFSFVELPNYNQWFFGDKNNQEGFARAWLHHQNLNPHHWEYWILRNRITKSGKEVNDHGAIEMPEVFVKEMVADWLGASMAHTGSWDMTEWLEDSLPKLSLHPKTWHKVLFELLRLGYEIIGSEEIDGH